MTPRPTDTQPPIRYYLDSEFADHAPGLELISIALVDDRDRTFYAVSSEFDETKVNDWVKRHVLPYIEYEPRQTLTEIRHGIEDFIGTDTPEFWAFCPAHDWVLFSWLWGGLGAMPRGYPGICRCIRQLQLDLGQARDTIPRQAADTHHALADAEWAKIAHQAVLDHERHKGS